MIKHNLMDISITINSDEFARFETNDIEEIIEDIEVEIDHLLSNVGARHGIATLARKQS